MSVTVQIMIEILFWCLAVCQIAEETDSPDFVPVFVA
jgi:hypothetical protein